jgi:hypothetical protein
LVTAKESVEHVTHRPESGHSAEPALPTLVVVLALLGVTENIERVRDELETLGRILRGVDVGVQFAGQLSVGLLNFVFCRIARYTENVVVIH